MPEKRLAGKTEEKGKKRKGLEAYEVSESRNLGLHCAVNVFECPAICKVNIALACVADHGFWIRLGPSPAEELAAEGERGKDQGLSR